MRCGGGKSKGQAAPDTPTNFFLCFSVHPQHKREEARSFTAPVIGTGKVFSQMKALE
jgi:hypothetical protein